MDVFRKDWFTELSPDDFEIEVGIKESTQLKSDGDEIGNPWPGQAFSLHSERVLFKGKSKFQDVLVFKSRTYGNVLVLDGIIQCTERDEFAYQEMLAHLPLFSHPNPRKVLIIGGGDGGIAREVLKHDCVESVTMCEIDEMVVEVSKKFLPKMSSSFSNTKLNLVIGDGFEFLKNHKNEYDVIITDSSDPVGPANSLFGTTFYELLNDALRDGGVLSSQCESIWLHLNLIAHMVKFNRRIFKSVSYATSIVSSYPSGSIGYLVASKTETELSTPIRRPSPQLQEQLSFYNPAIHSASFVLPSFAQKAIHGDIRGDMHGNEKKNGS